MQKDVHFNLTYSLALKAGIGKPMAKKIAWANYFTDELTDAKDYGIQTQCPLNGSWHDAQIQMSVIIPFHFVPGEDSRWPWKTVANSRRARKLVKEAVQSQNPLRLGIALHMLQDTFSHEGFSGWREDRNSCYPWYAPISAIPNVGHAEMRTTPDIVSHVWTDPRSDKSIKNPDRALKAAAKTFEALAQWNGIADIASGWRALQPGVRRAFRTTNYDQRKKRIMELGGDKKTRYSAVDKTMNGQKRAFAGAAYGHLISAMTLMQELPRQ